MVGVSGVFVLVGEGSMVAVAISLVGVSEGNPAVGLSAVIGVAVGERVAPLVGLTFDAGVPVEWEHNNRSAVRVADKFVSLLSCWAAS